MCGKAEEAINFYASVSPYSEIGSVHRYGSDEHPYAERILEYSSFTLENQEFGGQLRLPGGDCHGERAWPRLDHYWSHLSAVPEAERRGWLKDRYGLSW